VCALSWRVTRRSHLMAAKKKAAKKKAKKKV